MGFWNSFNKIGKQLPDSKEVFKIPSRIKETAINVSLNKIAIRYFSNNFHLCDEFIGEITRDTDIPLVIFNSPHVNGAVLLIQDFTFINRSRNNELTMDISENYPFGIDKNSDVIKFKDVDYYNNFKDMDVRNNLKDKSQMLYYKKKYKFFIPVMLNQIPLPIIKLDDADNRVTKIDKAYVKKLANVSQSFLRMIGDVKLLQRTGSKNSSGFVYVAILFLVFGVVGGLILSALLR